MRFWLTLLAGLLAAASVHAAGWRHSHGAQYYDSLAGDSWTAGNESVRSLGGTPGTPGLWSYAWFAWDVQYSSASGAQTTNDGYGGQNSQTIYNNIYALVGPTGTTPLRANDNWTWWGGRNDVSSEPGESWPLYTDGTFSAPTTGTTANSSTAITSVVSTATLVSGVKYLITGTCIPAGDTIASFTVNTITLTTATNSSGCGAGTALTITAGGTTQFLALVPHERKLIMLPYSGSGVGTADYVRLQRLKWTYWRTHRKYYFDVQQYFFGLSPNGSSGNAADDADVSAQALITSLNGNSHPNYVAVPLIAAAVRGPLDAMAGRSVWVLAQTIPDVPYDLGTSGSVGTVYGFGNITGWSIATDDPTFPGLVTINASTGELTRTATSPGTIPGILNLTVTATGLDYKGNAVTHTNSVRIMPSMIGAASTAPVGATFPRDAVSVVKRWPRLSASVSPYTNNAKWTLILRFKPGEDATTLNLWVAASTIIVNRTTGNKIAVTIKDSGAGTALSITSVTTNYTVANGYQWVLFSIDLSAPSYTLYSVSASGTATNIAPAGTPTAGTGLVGLATAAPNMFVASAAGASTFVGSVTEAIAIQGVAVDFSNSANRALFVNGSGNPVDQGASCATGLSATPEVCFRGVTGDWVTGKNFGSGADWGWNDTWLSGLPSSDPTGP